MEYLSDPLTTPLSVTEIASKAVNFEYNPLIPLRYWLRTADTMLKEANIYEREGNEQQAYLLLLRHAELLIKYLPDHPQMRLQENLKHVRLMRQQVGEDVNRLERLRPRIHARFTAYEAGLKEREKRQALAQQQQQQQQALRTSPAPSLAGSNNPYYAQMARPVERERIDASANPDLAVELARMEFARREKEKAARRGGAKSSSERDRQPSGSSATPPSASKYRTVTKFGGEVGERYDSLRQQYTDSGDRDRTRDSGNDAFDLQAQMQALNMQLNNQYPESTSKSRTSNRDSSGSQNDGGGGGGRGWIYDYPNIPKRSAAPSIAPLPQFPPQLSIGKPPYPDSRSPPPLPPLPDSMRYQQSSSPPPAVPRKTPLRAPSPPPIANPQQAFNLLPSLPSLPITLAQPTPPPPPKLPAGLTDPTPPPQPAPPASTSLKRANTYEFKTAARLESGQRLRTIFLPADLRHKFLEIAHSNTVRNLETCGVLCGTLIQNALFISRLVIPEQEVTSDTCDMKDEESLFAYVDGEDLMVLGWIHTHPTYECFMSSVDLHNHCGYQLMLPESIAVVCAPKYEPSWGVFRLTDPPGVKTIMTCQQKALFHRHEGGEDLYTDAMRPGHVVVVKEMVFEVVDLRK
ncbi:putative endosome-associated ubiquitin isopeptidase [Peziza echinospora]|nr:putative endosome-associated ubiquitin isopeptidase [Peziza echinospora]